MIGLKITLIGSFIALGGMAGSYFLDTSRFFGPLVIFGVMLGGLGLIINIFANIEDTKDKDSQNTKTNR